MATVKKRRRNPRGVYVITEKKVAGPFPYATYTLRGTTMLGQRIREQSISRADLLGRKQQLEVADSNAPDERALTSHLTADQVRQAEAAFLRLGPKHSLEFAVDHFIKTYRDPTTTEKLKDLAKKFVDDELGQVRGSSKAYLRAVRIDLEAFSRTYGEVLPHEFLNEHAYKYLSAQRYVPKGMPPGSAPVPISNKRWNNLRGVLHSFFEWMRSPPRRFVPINPFTDVETRKVKKKAPKRLSVREAAELMTTVLNYEGGVMAPYFALLLFAGIRPSYYDGEIDKLAADPRLPRLVNVGLGYIDIDEQIAKGGFIRKVTIQPTLKAWLRAFPLREHPILPKNHQKLIAVVRSKHKLSHDVLRHSFISFHIGKFKNIPQAAIEAGNSESIIRTNYLNPPTEPESDLFWQITPELLRDAEKTNEFMMDVEDLENLHEEGEDAIPVRVQEDMRVQAEGEAWRRAYESSGPRDNEWVQ